MSPKPGSPELRPNSPGTRVHLADLKVGDAIDKWHKRSGGYFLQEDLEVKELREDGTVLVGNGIVLLRDTGWGELRRTLESKGDASWANVMEAERIQKMGWLEISRYAANTPQHREAMKNLPPTFTF